MESVKQETLRGAKWAAIERFSVQGIQFLLGIIMARLLTPSDYGTIGMLAIFYAVSQTFIDSGFSNALIRKQDRSEADFSTVFYTNIVISIFCYSILFIAAPWVASFFNTEILCPILRVQSITLIINSMMGIHIVKLTVNIDFKALASRSIFATIVSGIIGIVLAYLGYGVWALVWQSIILALINMVTLWIYCKWHPIASFSWESFKSLFSYGSKLLASGLLNTIYNNLTTLVIGKYFSSKDLGYYTRGTQLATFPVTTIGTVLQKVTFPIFSRIQDNDNELIRVYSKLINLTSLVIFFACTLLAAIGDPLIRFLLTDKWGGAIVYLQVFCFAIMFDHICSLNLNLLQAKGRSDLFLKLEVIKKIISFAILFASIPFGVLGICISKIIYTQIAVYINTYYTGKLFNWGYVSQVKDFLKYLIFSVLACVPAYLFTLLRFHPVISLIFGCITSPLIYYIILRNDVNMREVLSLIVAKIPFRKNEDNR